MSTLRVGDVIHGFASGAFGRDSYDCRRVEAVGADWIVTRNTGGAVEMTTFLGFDLDDRSYCGDCCEFDAGERYMEEIGANLPVDVKRERALRLAEGCPRVDYRNML